MGRENLALKLTHVKGGEVYLVVHNIESIVPMAKTDKVEAHTVVQMVSGNQYQVTEGLEDIERRASQYTCLKLVK